MPSSAARSTFARIAVGAEISLGSHTIDLANVFLQTRQLGVAADTLHYWLAALIAAKNLPSTETLPELQLFNS